MAWNDDERNYQPAPGEAREPPLGTQHGVPRSRRPVGGTTETVRTVGSGGETRPGYTRSETSVVTDGMLGTANLESGPEKRNPEGSVDISNPDYHRTEGD